LATIVPNRPARISSKNEGNTPMSNFTFLLPVCLRVESRR
jgi:hypothetical protein